MPELDFAKALFALKKVFGEKEGTEIFERIIKFIVS